MKRLKELLDYIQPTKYIVSSDQYSDEYSIPVLTAGDTFLLGFTNDNDGIYPASKNNPIILFDDFTTAIKWVDFPFKVKSSACKILVPINGANLKYCYYAMRALNFDHTMHKRYWISEYSEQSINDYGQKNRLIVNELDTINSLIDMKKKRLSDFDEIIKSRFIELFGDVNTNTRGFDVYKIGSQFELGAGGTPKTNVSAYWENGTISWIGSNMCQDIVIYRNDGKYITEEGFRN
jgi:type I restriction enzyme S subunit